MCRLRSLAFSIAFLLLVSGVIVAPAAGEYEVVDTVRVSVDSTGAQANGYSSDPVVSADGSTIVYDSIATNLVSGDTNGVADVFAYDLATGLTTRISVDSTGAEANGDSYYPAVSADGSTIVYWSYATNLVDGDTNGHTDVFAYDVASGVTTRISVDSTENQANDVSAYPAASADGSTIVYHSYATNLVPGDTNGLADVFAYDVVNGVTTRISVDSTENQANGNSRHPAVSGDGSTIVYHSYATNLVPGDTNGLADVFAYDVASGVTTRISVDSTGNQANDISAYPAVSGDGSTIVYQSIATNLVPGDTNGASDVFVTGITDVDDPFDDDDSSVFEADIEWLAAEGITKGCNPPVNDRYCPDDAVTRGQMAAFLVRALNLTDDGGGNSFVDDDGSIFETDIAKLAAAGITRGCNPPTNTMFCPNDPVTRGQMAAFLVRALGYTDDGGGNLFVDDGDSIFETDIDKLATAGVTLGCNPPVNDRFCPGSNVARGQMAAFLHRALG